MAYLIRSPTAAVARQLFEARRVLRRGDEQDFAQARQYEGCERVVDHRFVVHRQQLFGDDPGDRVQSGAAATGDDDSFHAPVHPARPRRSPL